MHSREMVPAFSAVAHLAGFRSPVKRGNYLRTGGALMALKYGVDAAIVYAFAGSWISPAVYLAPLASLKLEVLAAGPVWLPFLLLVGTLPFAWIGGSMSVRRARDAGLHPALGLLFFVPVVQYLVIGTLAALPSRAPRPTTPSTSLEGPERGVAAALVGVASGASLAIPMTAASTLLLGDYGAALFVGGPFLMATVAGLLFNLRRTQTVLATALVGLATQAVAGGLLLLFALEGVICLAMAAPLASAIALAGALFGRGMAQVEARRMLTAPMVMLPVVAVVEPSPGPEVVHEVVTEVVVDAPPEVVWDVVVAFPEIPPDAVPAWYFQAGVAWPQRARIEGTGVGAVRYCEFSTGPFVEPITVWDPPHHLAFDVTESPPPMEEMSMWQVVHAPHIFDGTLQSQRGEFRLEALEDGQRTRLIGRTWYTLDMAPVAYWSTWSTGLIHRIHRRVLGHIASVSANRLNELN